MVLAVDDFPADELDFAGTVVNHDQLVDLLHQEVDYQLDHFVDGDDLFYILFTSGTTGSPKGVEITHTNICSFASWMVSDAFNLPHNQTFLGQPPFSFDLSNMYWLPALLTGSTIKALPRTVVQNFGQLFTVVPKLGVSVYVSTPSFVDMLLLSPDFNQEKMPELKYFLFCGEELTVSTAKRLFTNFPDAHIFRANRSGRRHYQRGNHQGNGCYGQAPADRLRQAQRHHFHLGRWQGSDRAKRSR